MESKLFFYIALSLMTSSFFILIWQTFNYKIFQILKEILK
ncbi:MAG: hypothetical protein K0R18_806 [Bacillales bacterium]|jgi:hypothetical protein|nr:hypothetical protein [Bacillales bacterium]